MDYRETKAAMERARFDRENTSVSVFHRNNSFAENDGDSAEGHLALKRKKAESNDQMPSVTDNYAPKDRSRSV